MCNLTENLWMNLTDGAIMCGRKFFDGSGGNNHALDHYKRSGFPLAVKLGTINPDGAGEYCFNKRTLLVLLAGVWKVLFEWNLPSSDKCTPSEDSEFRLKAN